MRSALYGVVEVIGLRAAPGLLNLWTLLLLGKWFTAADYGVYSLVLGVTGFLASMAFGPLNFAVVSQHAALEAEGRAGAYESSLVTVVLLIAGCAGLLGAGCAAAGWIEWSWIAPGIALGAYSTVQEILHARLKIWAFGAVAFSQAALALALTWLVVRHDPRPDTALAVFAASYALAAFVSLLFSGLPAPRRPDFGLLRGTFAVGAPYTVSTAIEQGLFLGMRGILLALGTPQQLGVFSFCVDLAQRIVGFLINAVSFLIVPTAFKAKARGGDADFTRALYSGAAQAAALAALAFLSVMLLRRTGWVAALNNELFDGVAFALLASAVAINRLKKLVLDSLAMLAGKASVIATGYAISAPVTLALGFAAMKLESMVALEVVYMTGYALAAALTACALRTFHLGKSGTL